jgi:formamidopyrimidine-DNA glycosylase
MPECIEVKWTSDCLNYLLSNKQANLISINDIILDKKIISISSHGKQLFISLLGGTYINIHFGLTGFLTLNPKEKYRKHTLKFDSIEKEPIELYFCESRGFGGLNILTLEEYLEKIGKLGIDIFERESMTLENFIGLIGKKKSNICSFLMNQSLLSGIGNYIKCEALYHSKISPFRTLDTLTIKEKEQLFNSILYVVYNGYLGGFTRERMEPYYAINKNLNCSYRSLSNEYLGVSLVSPYTFEVYKCKKDSKGNLVETMKTPDGRTTYYVPS